MKITRRQMLHTVSATLAAASPALSSLPASASPSANAVGLTGFDHMSINVKDFDAAVAWYRDTLDLEVDVSWNVAALDGKRLAYLSLDGSRVVEIVAADPGGAGLPAPSTFGEHFGRTGFGHLCFATDDVDATMAALADRGAPAFVKAETYPLDGTIYERRVAFITDPEGNVIEFGEPLRKRG